MHSIYSECRPTHGITYIVWCMKQLSNETSITQTTKTDPMVFPTTYCNLSMILILSDMLLPCFVGFVSTQFKVMISFTDKLSLQKCSNMCNWESAIFGVGGQ